MKISIVTVAFNAEATIAKAVASVVSQRQDGFELEYIIVDGASTDGTLAALEPHRDGIAHIISESDRGLYDAMNKGVAPSLVLALSLSAPASTKHRTTST